VMQMATESKSLNSVVYWRHQGFRIRICQGLMSIDTYIYIYIYIGSPTAILYILDRKDQCV
jgi:hypothetical protein